jgi:hypothetical protein
MLLRINGLHFQFGEDIRTGRNKNRITSGKNFIGFNWFLPASDTLAMMFHTTMGNGFGLRITILGILAGSEKN